MRITSRDAAAKGNGRDQTDREREIAICRFGEVERERERERERESRVFIWLRVGGATSFVSWVHGQMVHGHTKTQGFTWALR